jgi:hypothetical protein
MTHPSQATLALQAGGDLRLFARWRTERHLRRCTRCREEVEAFETARRIAPDLAEIPEINWGRMAAEMKANIRLGLAAGECVRPGERPLRETPLFTGARALVALASIAALLVTGIILEHPVPLATAAADDSLVVQATSHGIQVRKGGQVLRINNPAELDPDETVLYAPDAQGSMRARYVDPKSGYVTINNVYAE